MTIDETIRAAVNDFAAHGFDSQNRINRWLEALEKAIRQSLKPPHVMEQTLRDALGATFKRLLEQGTILSRHPNVARFTLQKIAPRVRNELDRRILTSVNLIRLNRTESIEKTLRRFTGWATSIPAGGSDQVDKRKVKQDIAKPMQRLPFEQRRVLIDQGHKMTANISAVIATDQGAIACKWFSHWRQPNYNYREDHKERDQHIYLIRGSWAQDKGFVKPGPNGYSDEITQPAEEPFCRCRWVYIYNLRDLPDDMVSNKGRDALAQIRQQMRADSVDEAREVDEFCLGLDVSPELKQVWQSRMQCIETS